MEGRIKPASCKAKGRVHQQYIVKALLKTFPELQPDDIKSTSMGCGGEDIQLSPAARKLIPYQIEAKSKATSQLHTYYSQAKTHGKYEPLVIVKKNRSEVLVAMTLEHFLKLLKTINETIS